ncbi:hypothetical protein E0Z10_g10808 [Xylaria hypoxylon]|uniref:Ecp2 effector protein domain-containing protein n=1 Tax=Xylaria hypoxylon TaxID=37992 RepID=A0A4Z0YD53_9PEZI|nr:hypothetical protein E0Z10_g10808 [Xylaria hypoxylon]
MRPNLSWLGLAVGFLASQVFAKDFQVTLWNSSDCAHRDPTAVSNILQIPRDNDDPNAGITCASLQGVDFNGWALDTHSQQVIAYVDTLAIDDGCELIFYNPGPPAGQYREEIAIGSCWQAYRRMNRVSACPSVNLNSQNIAVSYCCGEEWCLVPRGYDKVKDPVYPPAPPLSNDLPFKLPTAKRHPVKSRSPLQGALKKDSSDEQDLSKCQFNNSTLARHTYLPSVQVDDDRPCNSGEDLGGAACSWQATYASQFQLMTTNSLSLSESFQAGIEGILSETTTFGYDGSSSATNGQDISVTEELSLPQGRTGYPAFKQVLKCANGTFSECDVPELISLPNQEWCIPVLDNVGGKVDKAAGMFIMVDTT